MQRSGCHMLGLFSFRDIETKAVLCILMSWYLYLVGMEENTVLQLASAGTTRHVHLKKYFTIT